MSSPLKSTPSIAPENALFSHSNDHAINSSHFVDSDQINHHITYDELLDSFSKKKESDLESFSLAYIKEKTSLRSSASEPTIFLIFLLSFLAIISSVSLFLFIINILGLNGHGFIADMGLLTGGCLFLYTTVIGLGKFMSKGKFFKFQRVNDKAKKFITSFSNANTSHILPTLQEQLYQKLESKNIQSNTYVYSYLKESIARLEGEFNKLKYVIERQNHANQYDFTAFQEFIYAYEDIESSMNEIENIQFINNDN